jgi:hypothetical protein
MTIILKSQRKLVLPKFGMESAESEVMKFHQSSVYLYDLTSICWYESVLEMLPLIFLLHVDCFNSIMGYLLWMVGFGSLLFVRHIISWLTYTPKRSYAVREKYRIVKNGCLTIFIASITLRIFNSLACDFLLMVAVVYGFYTVVDFADVADKFIVDIDPNRGARDIKYVVSETLLRILSKLTILGGAIAFFCIQEAEIALRVIFESFFISKFLFAGVLIICYIEDRRKFANEVESDNNFKVVSLLSANVFFDIASLGLVIWRNPNMNSLIGSIIFKGFTICSIAFSSFIHDRNLFFNECKAKRDSIMKLFSSM